VGTVCSAEDDLDSFVFEETASAPIKISSKSSFLCFPFLFFLEVLSSAFTFPPFELLTTVSPLLFLRSSSLHQTFLSVLLYRSPLRKSINNANRSKLPLPSPPPRNNSRATSSPLANATHNSKQSIVTACAVLDSKAILSEREYPSEKVIRRASTEEDEARFAKNNKAALRTSSGTSSTSFVVGE